MKKRLATAVMVGVVVILGCVLGNAQVGTSNFDQMLDNAQKDQAQPQHLSPRNRLFLSPVGQPQRYDAVTINRYLMGSPSTNYRVMPVVRQPMYGPVNGQPW